MFHNQQGQSKTGENRGSVVSARVLQALTVGDVALACRHLEVALRQNPSNAQLRFQLATLRMGRGQRAAAAVELARVLRHAPNHSAAAQRLGDLLSQGVLPGDTKLDPTGLANALAHSTVDRDLIGAAAVRQMRGLDPLAQALAKGRTAGADVAARDLLAHRSAKFLRDDLLLAVMTSAIIVDTEIEQLLTALRRVILLELAPARISDPGLQRFATALAELSAGNEYVFPETPEETAAVAAEDIDIRLILAGDKHAGARFLAYSLYRDPLDYLPFDLPPNAIEAVHPAIFGETLIRLAAERRTIRTVLASIPHLGAIRAETSVRVAEQYKTHPYPRWRGVAVAGADKYMPYLQSFFAATQLSFAAHPFEVLIAGCGTGQQAVSAALDYGLKAQVQAIDISASSLGYAGMMAERFEVSNLSLALGDIGEIAGFEPNWHGRFQVIECSGVLHHMARPFEAWRGLLDCLAPGGIMLIGLYSRIARQELDALRAEASFPGAGCSDHELRTYRQQLLARGPDEPGAGFMRSRDAHTMSGFRDFFLHVSEQTTTIPEIAAFLDANGLAFKGFVTVPFSELSRRFPDEVWPGRLERWSELESERPSLFIGMYQFWVTRR